MTARPMRERSQLKDGTEKYAALYAALGEAAADRAAAIFRYTSSALQAHLAPHNEKAMLARKPKQRDPHEQS